MQIDILKANIIVRTVVYKHYKHLFEKLIRFNHRVFSWFSKSCLKCFEGHLWHNSMVFYSNPHSKQMKVWFNVITIV